MDPYEILGVARGCTHPKVREAFLVKVRRAHPDHGGDDTSFAQLRAAYEQILDELNRCPDAKKRSAVRTVDDDLAPSQPDRSVAPDLYRDWVSRSSAKVGPRHPSRRSRYLKILIIVIYLSVLILLGWANWLAWTWDPEKAARMADSQEHNAR
jgi:curved DNA-binding protein CbpA